MTLDDFRDVADNIVRSEIERLHYNEEEDINPKLSCLSESELGSVAIYKTKISTIKIQYDIRERKYIVMFESNKPVMYDECGKFINEN